MFAFDLPEVALIFEEYFRAAGVADRVAFVPGSFFDQELPRAAVVLMGHILHDWDLLTKKMLIRKAFDQSGRAVRSSSTRPSSTTIDRRMPLA